MGVTACLQPNGKKTLLLSSTRFLPFDFLNTKAHLKPVVSSGPWRSKNTGPDVTNVGQRSSGQSAILPTAALRHSTCSREFVSNIFISGRRCKHRPAVMRCDLPFYRQQVSGRLMCLLYYRQRGSSDQFAILPKARGKNPIYSGYPTIL